ncbi:hypothetical protein [Bacillus sp. WP8]|uniref:hypothetical protein n=1 Tax=Bacillus sp. WP8 TaxID=756828 RepID=UPI0028CB3047|nr:hypothetical protein [Bacillus sp. WP8]
MVVTAVNPQMGYENGGKIGKVAEKEGLRVKEGGVELEVLRGEELEEFVKREEMVRGKGK